MLNRGYLDALPETANTYGVGLLDDEKVVFTAALSMFGTETDRLLGAGNSRFTLTNKRMIADNGVGVWTVDILDDMTSCTKIEQGKLIFKSVYFSVTLNTEIIFDDGKQKLNGFHFYFNKKDATRFEEIMSNALN